MKERFLTGLAIIFVVAVVFLTKIVIGTPYIFDLFIGIVAILSALEISNILKRMGMYNHQTIIAVYPIVAYLGFVLALLSGLSWVKIVIIAIALIFLLAIISFFISTFTPSTLNEMRIRKIRYSKTQFSVNKAGYSLLGCVYPTLLIMLLVVFNHIEQFTTLFPKIAELGVSVGIIMLAVAFLIPFISDTFAYLTGTLIGGKKLAPKLSEKKTISGAIGGIGWTALLLTVIFFIFDSSTSLATTISTIGLEWWHIVILGILGSVACQFGDLFESYLKRKADLKDSSDILPGHGGVLDRVDGMCFSNIIVLVFFLFFII